MSPTLKPCKKSRHKKKKSKEKGKKKHKKETKYSESSSSSNSSEDEQEVWVEKTEPQSASVSTKTDLPKEEGPPKREDWMNLNSLFPCVFNDDKKASRKAEKDINKPLLDTLGQSSRELNPHWKDGGDGLPKVDSTKADSEQTMDVNWLKKSLRRAQEQAMSEGRSLHEIAAERWGSLEAIQSMIAKAEQASSEKSSNSKYIRNNWESNRRFKSENQPRYRDSQPRSYKTMDSKRINRSRSRSGSRDRGERYKRNDRSSFEKRQKQTYRKPEEDDSFTYTSHKSHHSHAKKAWKKDKDNDGATEQQLKLNNHESDVSHRKSTEKTDETDEPRSKEIVPLTEAEMNKLGARIVKAEIMEDIELANELKLQLAKARELGIKSTASSHNAVENVILAHTDTKGITRPLEPRNESGESSGSSKRRKNVQTHVSGERVRHYFDDDKYSLQQLFQREKGRSANEDDATFVKMASKSMDMNDIFEEQITRSQSDAKQDGRDRLIAIQEHKRFSKSLDNCRWCLDSKYMLKHMIVTMDNAICLSLPSHSSLTEGHCVLTPVQHTACQLQLDEDVWEKLKVFQRTLCKMFADENQYPIFFEIYKSRHKFPHMQLECVPLPKEIGESAPMYFKKALLECETEWSVNKKVIDLKQKDVRQAIPNGLSYFMVQFESGGYAHVIEDEQMFPKNFAEEIIGGMLDLDHDLWRKPRKENFDQQREKVLKFLKSWKKYDSEINHVD